jgi:hypothetical protein
MKKLLLAAALALAGQAIAGEDSTDRWGAGGTGPAWYQTPCGLAGFRGPVPYPDAQRPCTTANDVASSLCADNGLTRGTDSFVKCLNTVARAMQRRLQFDRQMNDLRMSQ